MPEPDKDAQLAAARAVLTSILEALAIGDLEMIQRLKPEIVRVLRAIPVSRP